MERPNCRDVNLVLPVAVEKGFHALLNSKDPCIVYFARRDLASEEVGAVEHLWHVKSANLILRKQQSEGFWTWPNPHAKVKSPMQDYDQLETYRRLGQLVEKYGMNRTHPAIKRAADFLFGKQTEEGDFRGIYGRQYTPNYTAGITELLIKAGYGDDPRIEKTFNWLLKIRQEDGGWAIPMRTTKQKIPGRPLHFVITSPTTLSPDIERSHLVTGVVLRAFAAHEHLRMSAEAREAAELLTPRLFKKDDYVDREAPEFWARVTFPFWFTDIVSVLDSLSFMGSEPMRDEHVEHALGWLLKRQSKTSLFNLKLLKTGDHLLKYWVTLAICRVLRRYQC